MKCITVHSLYRPPLNSVSKTNILCVSNLYCETDPWSCLLLIMQDILLCYGASLRHHYDFANFLKPLAVVLLLFRVPLQITTKEVPITNGQSIQLKLLLSRTFINLFLF